MIGGNRQISVYFILHPFTLHYTNFMSGCVCVDDIVIEGKKPDTNGNHTH